MPHPNTGKKWFTDGIHEKFLDSYDIEARELVKCHGWRLGRSDSHKPPKKQKGCIRFKKSRVYQYLKYDGKTIVTIPQENHTKENIEILLKKNYKRIRNKPYTIPNGISVSDEERFIIENLRKNYLKSISDRFSGTSWISDVMSSRRIKKELLEDTLSSNPSLVTGRHRSVHILGKGWIANPDYKLHRSKRIQ